jgi:hypothetical protein
MAHEEKKYAVDSWEKVPGEGVPNWLEYRETPEGPFYRIRYRRDGLTLKQVLEAGPDEVPIRKIKDAIRVGEAVIFKAKYGDGPKRKDLVTVESLCNEIVELKKSKDKSTYEQAEIFYRLHIKPYLAGQCVYSEKGQPCPYPRNLQMGKCVYGSDLSSSQWLHYKTHFRLHKPESPLFNHWKFFVTLFKYARERKLIDPHYKLEYNEKKEDRRARGMVLSKADLIKLLDHSSENWRDRIILGRYTGMRPGEVRELKKEFVDFDTWKVTLPSWFTKTRMDREFVIASQACRELLLRRKLKTGESPYFFPGTSDPNGPADKTLTRWHALLRRARINPDYTPHDLRHTYLTEMFKTSLNPALICFQAGLSLEEAQETYLHFNADDTGVVAHAAASQSEDVVTTGKVQSIR